MQKFVEKKRMHFKGFIGISFGLVMDKNFVSRNVKCGLLQPTGLKPLNSFEIIKQNCYQLRL